MITIPKLSEKNAKLLKQNGFCTTKEGIFSVEFIKKQLVYGKTSDYFSKIEPTGIYMSELKNKAEDFDLLANAISKSARAMQQSADESIKKINEASSKTRDSSDKLTSAIEKFMKISTRPDFQQKIDSVESLVSAMERLAKLEERGILSKVFATLSK